MVGHCNGADAAEGQLGQRDLTGEADQRHQRQCDDPQREHRAVRDEAASVEGGHHHDGERKHGARNGQGSAA